MINLLSTDPLTPPPPPQLHHKSLHMDIQLFVGNLYGSNKPEDSIPEVLPRAHNHMALIYVPSKKKL